VNRENRRPLIGVTVGSLPAEGGQPRIGVNRAYLTAIQEAGADVVLLAPPPAGAPPVPAAVLDRLDGLLLPGGPDVVPAHYGERPRPELGEVDADRDELELPLVRLAVERRLPLLGICRGHQVVNVALGGTLYQDVAADGLTDVPHETRATHGRGDVAHQIDVRPNTRLRRVLGGDLIDVNSLHHQAVRTVAPSLMVSAVSVADGVIEGLESRDGLLLTMQCHPEEMVGGHAWARELFRSFVLTAANLPPD
jgi:putative glutamine amidotransferase